MLFFKVYLLRSNVMHLLFRYRLVKKYYQPIYS